MSWKWLLAFPLAAWFVGTPVAAPHLREPIPALEDPICDYTGAVESYLLAYAYAREAPARTRELLAAAEKERALCAADTSVLRARIDELKSSLP